MADHLTPAVQDYLKAIHRLGGAEAVVSPVDIAERLDVRYRQSPGCSSGWRKRAGSATNQAGAAS